RARLADRGRARHRGAGTSDGADDPTVPSAAGFRSQVTRGLHGAGPHHDGDARYQRDPARGGRASGHRDLHRSPPPPPPPPRSPAAAAPRARASVRAASMTMRAEPTRRVRAWRVPVCLAASMLIAAGGCGDDDHRERTLAAAVTVTVPATANPWLAGMPDGTQSLFGDRAPETSPVHVLGIAIRPGTALRFSASGVVRHGPEDDPLVQTSGPDGASRILSHDFGPEHVTAHVSV